MRRDLLRWAAGALAVLGLAILGSSLALRVVPHDPVVIDLRAWLGRTPLGWLAPGAPVVLNEEGLAFCRRALAGVVLSLGVWLIWIRLRMVLLESRLARLTDSWSAESREAAELRERFVDLIETADGFTYRHDIDGSSLWLDDRGLRLLGYRAEDLAHLTMADLLDEAVLSEVHGQIRELAGSALPGIRQELPLRTANGGFLWVEVRLRLVRREGVAVAVEALARDVSIRRIQDAKAAMQRGVALALSESTSLEGAYRSVLATLCRELHWSVGQIWWVDEDYDVLRLAGAWSEGASTELPGPSDATTLVSGAGLPGRAWATGEPAESADPQTLGPAWLRTLPDSARFQRGVALPVRRAGRVLGVLALASSGAGRNPWSPMEALEMAGDQLASLTERERARNALREREGRRRAILEAALDCVITVDQDGRINEFNTSAEQVFGHERGVALGQRLIDLIVPEELRVRADEAFRASLGSVEQPFGGKRVEFEAVRGDGSRIPVELSISRVIVGSHPVFTGYLRDISDRKEIDRLKDELVSTVSHELRTPLSSMRGFVELLLTREYPREESRRFLNIVFQEIGRLSRLIDDFLDVQRLEARRMEYAFEVLDVRELVEEATSLMEGAGAEHEFEADLPEEPVLARVDPDRIRQVLRNLLSNAVKYSPDGGTITVRAGRDTGYAWFSVRDEGIGMDQNTRDQLFQKFFRSDNTMARRIGGTGLGLALVREIVSAHGGDVRVESSPGKGSELMVFLPLALPEDATSPR